MGHRAVLSILAAFACAVALSGAGCAIRVRSSAADGGIFRSADGGTSWQQTVFVAQGKKAPVTIGNLDVSRLLVSPVDAKVVLAVSAASGIYGTANGGENWQQVFKQPTQALALHPTERDLWYAAAGNRIFRTTDAAATWQELYLETTPQTAVTDIAVDQTKPTTLYAVTSKGVLLTSDDEGLTWQNRYTFPVGVVRVIINPRDARVLYVAAANGLLWRSPDRGETWADLSGRLRETADVRRYGNYQSLAMLPNRPDALLYATSYGMFRSYNGGTTWEQVQLVTSPGAVVIGSLLVDPFSEQNIWYTAGSALYRSRDSGASWETLRLPSGRAATALTSDPKDASILYLGFTKVKK